MTAGMMLPEPVLDAGTVYATFDRFVHGETRCAGMTAVFTGTDLNGHRVRKVTAADVREWAKAGLGDEVRCECLAMAAVIVNGKVTYRAASVPA